MIGSGYVGMLAAFAVTLGLLFLAVHLLKRVQGGGGGSSKVEGVPLRVLKRISVGPKQGVALIRVADRVLVVSVAENGTRLLTELDEEERRAALRPVETAPHPMPAVFRVRLPLLGRITLLALALALIAGAAMAAPPAIAPVPAPPQIDITLGQGPNALHLSGAVGLVVFMGLLTLLPTLFLLMTSFTRILIVLQFLRPALGTQSSPPTQILVALAVLLTGVVMNPVLQETNRTAVQPYMRGEITQADAYKIGVKPFREFMLANTREKDLAVFTEMSGASDAGSVDEIPTVAVVSAFVTSELRTAFQMGFVIFLPFIVVDVIVASVLMSLGMFMLPPMMVSLPFKLLLFVLADGWTLVVQNLVQSFKGP